MTSCLSARRPRSAVTFLLSVAAVPAFAQPATETTGSPPAEPAATNAPADASDIVVTATRQSQSLSRVPVSVAAFTQERLDQQGVRSIADVVRLTPGLSQTAIGANDVAGNSRTISIRGISSNVGSATTGIYIDDTPIQTRAFGNVSSNVYPQIFDLERVEVLRGPQGTLFGAGSEGGAIRFITPQPSLTEMTGYARSEIATTEGGAASYEGGASIGVPIVSDKLAVRLSGWYRRDGGYIDRVDPVSRATVDANANRQNSYTLRGALKWQATEDVTLLLSVFRQQEKLADANTYFESYSDPGEHRFASARVAPSSFNDRFTLPSLNLQYDGEGFSVISTTSLFRRKIDRQVDYSNFVGSLLLNSPYGYGPGEASIGEVDDKQRDFTQEVRIQSTGSGPLNWVLGGFYSRSKLITSQFNDDRFFNIARTRLGLPTFPLFNDIATYGTDAVAIDKQRAIFGQVDYEIVDGLKATAGLRYAAVTTGADRTSYGPVAGTGGTFSGKQTEHPLTPKFGLSYQSSPSTLFYAAAAKGYRIGGVNGPQSTLCADALAGIGLSEQPLTFDSDSLWSYEGGVKTRIAGLRVEASVFDISWKNIQRQVTLPACGASFVANFGKARSTGFDLQAEYNGIEGLSIGGSIGYANARLTSDVVGSANGISTVYGLSGDKIGGPPWSWTLFGEYEAPLSDRIALYGRADYQHVGNGAKVNFDVYGVDPLVGPSEQYDQVSLRTGARLGGADVSLFVNNLLNEQPTLYRMRYTTLFDNFFQANTLRPRTWGMTASYRF
jgi:outer membrane receptor protein involved in Fe transport